MLCFNNPSTDVYFNLAVEEYLLKKSSEDIFMLYQNEPSVVVGKYQDVDIEVNLDFVKEKAIKIARRISGGGSVFQDSGNFNFCFIENNAERNFDKYVHRILDFLLEIGIHASPQQRGIFINELKISGSAQYVYCNRILYHATLLYSSDLESITSSLDNNNPEQEKKPKSYVKSVKSPVTNIIEYLNPPLETSAFRNLVFDYFFQKNKNNNIYELKEEEISSVNVLKKSKYETPEWIFKDYLYK